MIIVCGKINIERKMFQNNCVFKIFGNVKKFIWGKKEIIVYRKIFNYLVILTNILDLNLKILDD